LESDGKEHFHESQTKNGPLDLFAVGVTNDWLAFPKFACVAELAVLLLTLRGKLGLSDCRFTRQVQG